MMRATSLSLPISREQVSAAAPSLLSITAVAGAMALGAWARFPLPHTPVPVTMQTFVVLLAPFLVGRWNAAMGVGIYLALGLAGAPLLAVSFGPTFGFLLAFIAAPYVMSFVRHPAAALAAGTLVIYTMGIAWVALWSGTGVWAAFLMAVAPFIPGDIAKATGVYLLIRNRPEADEWTSALRE